MFLKNSKIRLLISDKEDARTNMAVDNALVNIYQEGDSPILRLYSWKKSFTIGVSQKFQNFNHLMQGNNFAKRITGGGVLYHGCDISYSLIIPKAYVKNYSVKDTYEKICEFLLEFYNSIGLEASYAKDISNIDLIKSDYCQIGFEAYDIIINNFKIGGNAQKRTKDLVFQHGSIPIEEILNNNSKNLGKSLYDLGINLTYKKAQLYLIVAFEKTFNVKLEKSMYSKKEKEELDFLLKDKYNYDKYTTI